MTWQVIVNGGESILEALDLEARYRISFWDAEDLSDGQTYGSVRVVDPLRAGA